MKEVNQNLYEGGYIRQFEEVFTSGIIIYYQVPQML